MNPIDLEQIVDAELKRLPLPKAPRTLLPRVLAATAAQPQARPARGWVAWPRAGQFAGGLVAALVLIGTWKLMAFIRPLVGELLSNTGLEGASTLTRNADDAATVVRVLWEVLLEPVATYVTVLAISFALACAALWTAVERLTPGGVSHR
jgi:hypothetical protein